jgi:predicted metal-dependent TIM-barrel fold hydrolase
MKEAQLQKIQQVLRTIQEKFHDLTQKESRSVSASSGSKPLGPEAKRVADLIIKQKEAVYQHERQLLDQRNRLLHEIRELTSREEHMAGSR